MIRELRFEIKYLFEEIILAFKHPKRKATYQDIKYHWSKIWNILIFHPWYCLKRGIRNYFIWGKMIWELDVFDHYFLTEMMDKQFSEMEKFWYSDKPHVMAQKRIAKRITWIRKLYKMWKDEYYSTKCYEEHEAKYGESKFESEVCKVDEYGVPILYKMKNSKTEEEKIEYRDKTEIAWKKDDKVFNLWVKNLYHIRKMWD